MTPSERKAALIRAIRTGIEAVSRTVPKQELVPAILANVEQVLRDDLLSDADAVFDVLLHHLKAGVGQLHPNASGKEVEAEAGYLAEGLLIVVDGLLQEQIEYTKSRKENEQPIHMVQMKVDDQGLINWVTACGELPPWDGTFDRAGVTCAGCRN